MARTRRGWRSTRLAATVIAALACTAPAAHAAAGDATNYLVDAAHSSSQPTGGPTGLIAQRWTRQLDGGPLSYPLIVGGRVFVVALDRDRGPSVLHALDAATGTELWSRELGWNAAIAADDQHLFADSDGHLVALDPATGTTRWVANGLAAGPITTIDGAVFGLGTGSALAAFAADTGQPRWRTYPIRYPTGLAVAGGHVLTEPGVSVLDALDAATGSPQWTSTATTDDVRDVSVLGGTAYLTPQAHGQPGTRTFDVATGAEGPIVDADFAPAADAQGTYTLSGGTLTARGPQPGSAARWTFTGDTGLTGAPLTAGGRVWVASSLGKVYGLDPLTGAVQATLPLGAAFADPAVDITDGLQHAALAAGGGLLVVPAGDRLVAFSGAEPVPGATAPTPPTPADTTGPADATSEHQDAARDGLADGAPAPPLAERWVRRATGTTHALIVGDRMLLLEAGPLGTQLTAAALADGHTLWTRPLDLTPTLTGQTPAIAAEDGRVFVVDGRGRVLAYATDDGRPLWSRTEFAYSGGTVPDVVAVDGTVYADWPETGSAAIDAQTGERRWGTAHIDGGSAVVTDDAVVVGDDCGRVEAITRAAGDELWSRDADRCTSGGDEPPFLLADGRLLGSGANVLDTADGAIVDTSVDTAAAGHGLVLGIDRPTRLFAQRYDGPRVWATDAGENINYEPLLSRDHVYLSTQSTLRVLSLGDGHLEWSTPATWGGLVGGRGVLLRVSQSAIAAYDAAGAGPRVTLDDATPAPTRDAATATVGFTLPAGAAASCAIDAGSWTPCASPWRPPGTLGEGEYVLRVRATAAGVTGAATSTPLVVDRTGPQVTVLGGLPARTRDQDESVSFRADEPASVTCAVDGAAPSACEPPLAFHAYEGTHTLALQATDAAGNVGPVKTTTFVVDDTPPVVHIERAPTHPDGPVIVRFTVDDPTATTECRLDSARAYTPCTSPVTVPPDDRDEHTFSVRATDDVGNQGWDDTGWLTPVERDPYAYFADVQPAPATRTTRFPIAYSDAGSSFPTECRMDDGAWTACSGVWVVRDLPEGTHVARIRDADDGQGGPSRSFTVDWAPPSNTIVAGPPAITTASNVTFAIANDDTEYSLVGRCGVDGAYGDPCTRSARFTGLAPGVHRFSATYTDAAGNVAEPLTYTWTQVAPAGPGPAVAVQSAPVDGTTRPTASFELSPVDGDADCRVDGGAWGDCATGSAIAFSGLAPGAHVAEFTADGQATPTSVRWTVAPRPAAPTGLSAEPKHGNAVTLGFTLGPGQRGDCWSGPNDRACTSGADLFVPSDGWRHTASVAAIDCYGTASAPAPASVRFTMPQDDPQTAQGPSSDPAIAPGDYGCADARPATSDLGVPGGDGRDEPPVATDPPPVSTDPSNSGGLPTGPLTPTTVPTAPPVDDPTAPAPAPAPVVVAASTPPAAVPLVDVSGGARADRSVTDAKLSLQLGRALRGATLARTTRAVTVRLVAPATGPLRIGLVRGTAPLGSGSARVRRGRAVRVTLRLTAAGRRALRAHHVAVSLRVQLDPRGRLPGEARRTITLRG